MNIHAEMAAVAPSDGADADERARGGPSETRAFSCLCVPPGYIALVDLLVQPLGVRTVYPRVYLSASHEVFGITLITTWILTLIFFPKQVFKHPAKPIIGSFNPCFGWDYPPASYLALAGCSVNVYMTWRYAWLEVTRTHLSNPGALTWPQWFAKWSAIALAFASNCWLLLWVVGPEDGNWKGHTALFVFYAAASYLACLGNYVEMRYGTRAHVIETKHTAFILAYGLAALFLPTVYFIDLIWYERGEKPVLPPWVTQTADILWILCVMQITVYTPPDAPLRQIIELIPDEEEQKPLTSGCDGG